MVVLSRVVSALCTNFSVCSVGFIRLCVCVCVCVCDCVCVWLVFCALDYVKPTFLHGSGGSRAFQKFIVNHTNDLCSI